MMVLTSSSWGDLLRRARVAEERGRLGKETRACQGQRDRASLRGGRAVTAPGRELAFENAHRRGDGARDARQRRQSVVPAHSLECGGAVAGENCGVDERQRRIEERTVFLDPLAERLHRRSEFSRGRTFAGHPRVANGNQNGASRGNSRTDSLPPSLRGALRLNRGDMSGGEVAGELGLHPRSFEK